MKSSPVFFTVTSLLALWLTPSLAKAEFSRAPYLQLANENSIHIVWRTTKPMEPVVRFGTSRENLDQSSSKNNILVRKTKKELGDLTTAPLHSAPDGTIQFEAKLTGLQPDTQYYYAIYDGSDRLTTDDGSYRFRTHPKAGAKRDIYFWAVGDSGRGNKMQKDVHQAMVDYNKKHNLHLDMYLHVGDMAYGSGRDPEFQAHFFKIYDTTLRNTVCWPAMGNHEGYTSNGKTGVGPYYDAYVSPTQGEAGGVPSGKESYYSFDFGRAHFVVLNSHDLDRKPTAAMAQWLREDLAKTNPKNVDWLIAYWHHPPYTKGSHDSDKERQLIEMREHIMPILESSGVDLVLTGHSHIYERSMLMDGAYETPTIAENKILDDGDGNTAGDGAYQKSPGLNPNQGTIQIVTGHGGTGLHRRGYSPVMKRSILQNGSTLVHISGDTLNTTMLNYRGEVVDEFQIEKKQAVTPKRIAHPWQPSQLVKPVKGDYIIPKKSEWHYLAGSFPSKDWISPDFDDSDWKTGKAGFGYGDADDTTVLPMKGKYTSVYVRKTFELKKPTDRNKLWLDISYDDAFILYINGKQIIRNGVKKGSGKNAKGIAQHEAQRSFSMFDLSPHARHLKVGKNIIAIEGHNHHINSSDFTLHPALFLRTK
ncbi:MAG: metallophosphoesterase family protein [Verrucomicrobiae bacterium]|nr:metallophosphoesterase family protein [Verrucomicrobiae bacterium]NNJ86039.1 metallophosphoesterase family protein [Akkermansiaceae bacterium]